MATNTKPKAAAKPKAATKSKPKAATKSKPKAAAKPKTERRETGNLESFVVDVITDYEAGKVEVPEGKTLTPQRIVNVIDEREGDYRPSAGAVTAALKRMDECGFILTHDKPYSFKRISAVGAREGLDSLKAKLRAKKAEERKAAKSKG